MRLPARDAELVQIVDAALTDAARRAGAGLVCREGCTPCCHGAFAIHALDAARLRAGMRFLDETNPMLAADLRRRAATWIEAHAYDFPGDLAIGRIGDTEAERERFEEFANEAACPALDPATGRCDVYAYRPMTCRVFGPPVRVAAESGDEETTALGHCELCFLGAEQAVVEACEMAVPHELEAEVLDELRADAGDSGETVVAFALLVPQQAPSSTAS